MRESHILHCSLDKMLVKVILLFVLMGASYAELPRMAPYAPSGWRPQQPFNLPDEYLPPVGANVEISKAHVQHAGTINVPQESLGNSLSPATQYGAPDAPDADFKINYLDEDDATKSTDLQSNIKEGRYYIVSPDNKLQRVQFRIEDGAVDGFTAQLRYSSVGELQDPVYKYNKQGYLQRVLK